MTAVRLSLLAALAVVAGCANDGGQLAAEPSPTRSVYILISQEPQTLRTGPMPSPAPTMISGHGRTFTTDDDGAMVELTVDESATLRLDAPTVGEPSVDGDAVRLVPVASAASAPSREWELRAVAPGVSHLTLPGGAALTFFVDSP